MITGRIFSVQVGQPQKLVTAKGREWESAIIKTAVDGPVPVGTENVSGDKQANRRYHGGPDKVVCCYASEHYSYWRALFDLDMPYGAFGENLTLAGLTEDKVCIGDSLAVGSVILQVSQPRLPCVNVSRRWNQPKLPKRMEETGYTGFYCRVLQTGELVAGEEVTVITRPYPDWTILRANQIMFATTPDPAEVTALRAIPLLSGEWRRILGRMLRRLLSDNPTVG